MMKYAVIGAGVSGLSMAGMLLKKGHEVVVYERDSRPGGLIKCTEVQGNLYHRVGGMCSIPGGRKCWTGFGPGLTGSAILFPPGDGLLFPWRAGLWWIIPLRTTSTSFLRPSVPPSSMSCWNFTGILPRSPRSLGEFFLNRFGKTPEQPLFYAVQ